MPIKSEMLEVTNIFWNIGCNRTKLVAGDFDGDGKDEIAAFYDYDNDNLGLFLSSSDVSSFEPKFKWESGPFQWDWNRTMLAAGDFNNGVKDEIAVFYNYATGPNPDDTGLGLFSYDGNIFQTSMPWRSWLGNWNWKRTLV